jgi:hypothetical protein
MLAPPCSEYPTIGSYALNGNGWFQKNPSLALLFDRPLLQQNLPGAEVLRQQRRRCFLSLHFLFKDLTQYQE